MINVDIIADSVSPKGDRVTTFILEYPRFIHSELMTHRVFSRNCASSRAIPIQAQIELAKQNLVIPVWTGKKKGMQGEVIYDDYLLKEADVIWMKFVYLTKLCSVSAWKRIVICFCINFYRIKGKSHDNDY